MHQSATLFVMPYLVDLNSKEDIVACLVRARAN